MTESLRSAGCVERNSRTGVIVLRKNFQKLFRQIDKESKKTVKFLNKSPRHRNYSEGTILVAYALPASSGGKQNRTVNGLIPQYEEDVRWWSILDTPYSLTSRGDLVAIDVGEDWNGPYVISPLNFETIAELRSLVGGLKAMRR